MPGERCYTPCSGSNLLRHFMLCLTLLILQACTAEKQATVADAVETPFNDLNLVKAEIPAVLEEAVKQPYALPVLNDCGSLDAIILGFDEVLGPDLDAIASDTRPSLARRASHSAGKAAVSTLRRTAEDLVPYRRWVRKLSGAERHSQRVDAAISAGIARRAFIKGLRAAQECT